MKPDTTEAHQFFPSLSPGLTGGTGCATSIGPSGVTGVEIPRTRMTFWALRGWWPGSEPLFPSLVFATSTTNEVAENVVSERVSVPQLCPNLHRASMF